MAKATVPFAAGFDASATRIRNLNDKLIEAAKQSGLASIDRYQQRVHTLLDFGQKLADSTKVKQVSALARTQATIIDTLTSAYAQVARELLK
jgi:hypothetical protein